MGRREKLLIRKECGYYKIRWMEEKKREREKGEGYKSQENFTRFRKEGNYFGFFFSFFSPPFCNFYHYLGGEVEERL